MVALAAPLPGRFEEFDKAVLKLLTPPFKEMAEELVDTQHLFTPAALSRYMARVMAPALAGKKGRPWRLLGINWDLSRYTEAEVLLGRPDMQFSPADLTVPVIFVLPSEDLGPDAMKPYELVEKAGKGTARVESLSKCGFHPQVTCPDDVVDIVEDLADRVF